MNASKHHRPPPQNVIPFADSCSPYYALVPPEIRHEIFSYALSDFPDPSANSRYNSQTCYTRPSYFASRKSDLRLLRTCRAVYREAWFLPFTKRTQTFWLCTVGEDRAPPGHWASAHRRRCGRILSQITAEYGGRRVEIEKLHVFAQMYKIENGELCHVLRTPHLHPRSFTLTVRHTDWWWWEHDQGLYFEAKWIPELCLFLSSSVKEIRIQLESLERKKGQVDAIVKHMSEHWYFKRSDNEVLYPDATLQMVEVSRWTGSSTWHGNTWTRDEARPGEVDYYVAEVVFRPRHVLERLGGHVSVVATENAKRGVFDEAAMRCRATENEGQTDQSQESAQILVDTQDMS
ncbi:hypothetical protein DL546_000921 [Coniochaeta pulveracea]|uniref:F-box domain-containing protein n=1 Tax=Coniochaeta pulveracea TaxID=177199 RepID=A0A420XXG5_9PEZI|nr:hypothetical protein DL546_000921 [Coniochaeta pulveracea]